MTAQAVSATALPADMIELDPARRADQKRLSEEVGDAARGELWQRSSLATRAHFNLVAAPGASDRPPALPCPAISAD
eukprot:5942652-Pyramimonas_sp.AAC.1